jgi:DNA repair exonuclease SbcCD ATPase subunit
MKIIELSVEKIKRIIAVALKPTGEIVTIAGRNGAGKSTLLDSIEWALGGARGIQAKPIRKGEQTGRIQVKLGSQDVELIVTRTFSEGKRPELTVTTAEGFTPPGGAQSVLDALLGDLSFDPHAFDRMDERAKFNELLRVFPIGVDPVQIKGLNDTDYAKRTEVNREAKQKRQLAAAVVIPADAPTERVDENALIDQLQAAGETNAQIETRKAKRSDAEREVANLLAAAKEARETAAELRRQADEYDVTADRADDEAATLRKKIDTAPSLPEPVDVAAIRAELEAAQRSNRIYDSAQTGIAKQKLLTDEADAAEAASKSLTDRMAAREKEKADAIAAAKFPVAGLSVGDGVVTLDGLPLEQASTSDRTKVSVAIAMAANPKLRVILIRDGSLLDEASLKQIEGMAKDADYQVWIERVDSTGTIGFVIEDGSVKA